MNEDDIESEVEEVMEEVDRNICAGTDVSRHVSIKYYESIIDHCRSRLEAIKADEAREDTYDDDADDLSDMDDED